MQSRTVLIIITFMISISGISVFAIEPPIGFIRNDDVIYPAQWEKISKIGPDSLTIKRLRGQKKGIVILYQWRNRRADTLKHRRENYMDIFFSTGVHPTGSLNDYFLENSYDNFGIAGNVTKWYTAPDTYDITYEYGWMSQAVILADPDVDFSQFDSDSDGVVDIAYLLHAGAGGEETRNPDDPWSWAWVSGANIPTNDGVIVDGYSLQPECHADTDSTIMGMAVTRHESGHILAWLPDLYDSDRKLDTVTYFTPNDWNDHPVQDWCAMGYGGYGLFSYRYGLGPAERPTHFCGLFKTMVGWNEPATLTRSQPGVTIYSIERHDSASLFKVAINGSRWEYFMIENRHSVHSGLFDHLDSDYSAFFKSFTPGSNPLDAGIIITHVDETLPQWGFNRGTPTYPHYGAVIEDAGYNPAKPWNGREFTEFWYPYECQVGAAFCREDAQTAFTPYTTPNSNGYNGRSGIWITNISQSGDIMTFDFFLESDPPVFADVYRWPDTIFTGPYPVYAVILDTFGIASDSLYYSINNGGFIPVDRDSIQGDSIYWYKVPYVVSPGDSIRYYIVAKDNAVPPNRGISGIYKFNVMSTGLKEVSCELVEHVTINLCQNNPNPFQKATYINYQLSTPSFVTLRVYNVLGELITSMINDFQGAGNHRVCWKGLDSKGSQVTNGIYFYCLEANGRFLTRKMILAE